MPVAVGFKVVPEGSGAGLRVSSGWLFREVVVWDAVCPGSGADRALGPRSEAQDGVGERKLGTKTVAPLLPPDRSCD